MENFNLINTLEEVDINNIYPTSDFYFTEEETFIFIENTLELIDEFIKSNPNLISDCDYYEIIDENIKELVLLQISQQDEWFFLNEQENEEDIEFILNFCYEIYFTTLYKKRHQYIDFNSIQPMLSTDNFTKIKNTINYLKNIPQPTQRTPEWYEFRRNLITASNAYKIFESDANKRQIINEKCIISNNIIKNNINTNNPMHWGQKYEPISVMIYEHLFNTKIGDFGCIKHSKYNFLGASPDGICIDELSPYFGYMLEIKNPVSREITGIPNREYWIQCQLQMEVCNLDNCHFLETKFTEYETEKDFLEDNNIKTLFKGIIIYFSYNDEPFYVYKPLNILNEDDINKWCEQQYDIYTQQGKIFITFLYWKCENYSCILIERNTEWFNSVINKFIDIWDIIIDERKKYIDNIDNIDNK